MIDSPRLLFVLLIALLGVGAGCSSAGEGAEPEKPRAEAKEYPEPITPKAYGENEAAESGQPRAGGRAYYGGYHERFGLGASFDADGWEEGEIKAASFIHAAGVYFHFDSAALSADAKAVLRQKAERLKAFPQLSVLIAGHSDERGSDEYNLALGEKRAKAAYAYMVGLGVPAAQLDTISYGKRYPVAGGTGEKSWSQNRRDEFMVFKP